MKSEMTDVVGDDFVNAQYKEDDEEIGKRFDGLGFHNQGNDECKVF